MAPVRIALPERFLPLPAALPVPVPAPNPAPSLRGLGRLTLLAALVLASLYGVAIAMRWGSPLPEILYSVFLFTAGLALVLPDAAYGRARR